ncbi:NADP-binding protein [Dacryopinax primogenitus]|uniref:NADP-binding protein n=1 Tax=Dacryopinax primogenitus (strain DJM 731) TaxID=1858805 RepID=M5FYQ9_DACPD|nr:NADP-binding protein [Dacryopinax primogenitus]EJU03171.1 NADP-binding protein [Dacryopinax primogenitus]
MAPKVWLITGSSSGFGRIMTELVLENGDICVATSIEPTALSDLFPKYGKERLRLVNTDVTQVDEVALAFSVAEQAFGHVDVVFNNAGVLLAAEVEGTPEDRAKDLFDVNFWGNANVLREAVRFFREVNGPERGGKLIQVTSCAGISTWPTLGYYAASKHAMEALARTIVLEVQPEWNIQIMLVEPGFMRTPMLNFEFHNKLAPIPAYATPAAEQTRADMVGERIKGDPQKAMELVHKVAQREKLPLHLPIGADAVDLIQEQVAELTRALDEWGSIVKDVVFAE